MNAADAFRTAILASLEYAPEAVEPGRMQRFSTTGKRSDLAGWSLLFPDERAGIFGCFRLGVSEVWSAKSRERMTTAERTALRRQVADAKAQREREQQTAWRRNADRIAFLWRQSKPVEPGDAAHLYLRSRLAVDALAVPACLRLHPAMPYMHDGETVGIWPAMVAPITSRDGRVLALHRTYLEPSGRKADVPGPVKKLTPAAGLLRGAGIPLADAERSAIGIAEGIETALAASLASGLPVHAAYCATALECWNWPSRVQRVVIFADADEAGRAAAAGLRSRVLAARLRCDVMTPTTTGTDWCDVWAARATAGAAGSAA